MMMMMMMLDVYYSTETSGRWIYVPTVIVMTPSHIVEFNDVRRMHTVLG